MKEHFRKYDICNNLWSDLYYENGLLHRINGPARIWYYPEKRGGKISLEEYWFNGKAHREHGPATIMYYASGQLERQIYFINGKIHRFDGPADICHSENGEKIESYFINNLRVDINRFVNLMHFSKNKTETLIQILNSEKELRCILPRILIEKFRNEIEQSVIENLSMFM